MKYLKYMIPVLGAVLTVSSCGKEHPTEFTDRAGIYFSNHDYQKDEYYQVRDSINHSFVRVNLTWDRDTVMVRVSTTGFPTGENRSYKVVQTNAGKPLAAVAGTHYVPFEELSELIFMPAAKTEASLPVIFYRHTDFENNQYRLELELIPNENFIIGIDKLKTFTVTTSNFLEKPTIWDTRWRNAFGTWSRVKMQFLINYVTGDIDWEVSPSPAVLTPYRLEAIRQLAEFEKENGPLLDENDQPVVF